jgi:G3E family GTPase
MKKLTSFTPAAAQGLPGRRGADSIAGLMHANDRIPVTVLTGFLGSGKTTLLNRILTESHGQRIAVIENEFGEIGVDQELVINAEEEIFEMNNGCICCTVRGDLIRILGNLMTRRDKFDRIVLETTGLANPGPVAQTFFVDEAMRERFALDGIVTMVDARHFEQQILDSDEATTQIAFADVIVLNKADLVTAQELDALEQRVRGMNAMARIVRADPGERASVPMNAVLGIGGFDLARALQYKPTFLEPEYPFEWAGAFELAAGTYSLVLQQGPDPSIDLLIREREVSDESDPVKAAERVFTLFCADAKAQRSGAELSPQPHVFRLELPLEGEARFKVRITRATAYWLFTQHLPSEFALRLLNAAGQDVIPVAHRDFAPGHSHDERVGSFSLESTRALDPGRFQSWLSRMLQIRGTRLYRMKGFLNFEGSGQRVVIQGVHMVVDTSVLGPWGDRDRRTQLVFIGRDLDRDEFRAGFEACLT